MDEPRQGILCAGNFIIDNVKIIDSFPEQDMLVNIIDQTSTNGGGAYNVLKDLHALGSTFRLEAAGMVGGDADGDRIADDLERLGIDIAQLHRSPDAPTSYTDAMTVEATGRRTFFHQRGANAQFAPGHFSASTSSARWLHLAYLMLLDSLDAPGATGVPRAIEVLKDARDHNMVTSVDLVSIDSPEFSKRVLPCLPWIDFLFLNEIEAGILLGRAVATLGEIEAAAHDLIGRGVREAVVLHRTEGVFAVTKRGDSFTQPSLDLPADFISGATGAGDAFVAGCLDVLVGGGELPDALTLGVCTAAASLTSPGPSEGVLPRSECLALSERYPMRSRDV